MERSYDLTGKVIWITGSSRGIGNGVARYLAEQGAHIVMHGTTATSIRSFHEGNSLQQSADEISAEHGVEVTAVAGDLTDPDTVHRIAEEIRLRHQKVDVLINCAGGDIGARGVSGPLAGKPESNDAVFISLEDLSVVLARNLMTCIYCCREIAPGMMERKSGRIINVGSIAAMKGMESSVVYSTAKAGVHQYSRCLAVQLRPYNVTVNVVAPGDIVTPRWKASREYDESKMVEDGTLDRYGRVVEVARLMAFLASDASGYITGQVIRIDGGMQCWPG
jgi:3-oxoacyl-[acyl-carrier protein] reductase